MCKVSVLIPVYNVEEYLCQCLDSVVHQSLSDMEIICINDGSTDGSRDILYEYAAKDNRIRIIDKKNTGYGDSMNCGLRAAVGEYIGIVESDDFASPDMFEILYRTAMENQADIVFSNYYGYYEGKDHFIDALHECEYHHVFSIFDSTSILYVQPTIWKEIYRREFLLTQDIWFNPTPGASFQDTSFNFKTISAADRLYAIPEAFLHYRMDRAGSSVKSKDKAFCICDEYMEIWHYWKKKLSPERKKATQNAVIEMQYDGYWGNFERSADSYKETFLKRFADDFHQLEKSGMLQRLSWRNPDYWMNLQILLTDWRRFFIRYGYQYQNKEYLRIGFIQKLRDTTYPTFLFGTGKVAQEVFSNLSKWQIPVAGFLVTDCQENPSTFNGKQVFSIEDERIDSEQSLVLLSLAEKTQMSVMDNLLGKGYPKENLLLLPMELREAIKE